MSRKPPVVVAELGRPETAEETALRKAEASRARRSHQTTLNLVLATLASLGIVAFLVAVVVRPDTDPRPPVEYATIAAQADEAVPLAAPTIPADWYANSARITAEGGVRTWEVGFITGDSKFIGLDQGIGVSLDTNPTWLAGALNALQPTGSTTIDGVRWTVYDHRDEPDPGNYAYALSAQFDGSTIALHGTASDADFTLVAAGVSQGLSR